MTTKRRSRFRLASRLGTLALCVGLTQMLAGQGARPSKEQAEDIAGFKEFTVRVEAYLTLQKAVVKSLPALKSTDLPEMITVYQQVLARKIREARPGAKPGNLFTSDARDAFRHASRAALESPRSPGSRAYMRPDAADSTMRLVVNGIYPDSEPITALPPALLAAFPTLPIELAYRVVGRTLVVVDVESRLIVDFARLILSPAS